MARDVTVNLQVDSEQDAETLALLDRIERGEAEMAGPFKTMEEYKAWLAEEDEEI